MRPTLYIDSSVLVALAADNPQHVASFAQKRIQESEKVVTSELSVVECQAGICTQAASSKAPQGIAIAEQNLNRLLALSTLFSIDSIVLGHARALVKRHRVGVGLRSLDALHVATANLLHQELSQHSSGSQLRYLTADRRQHEAFSAEGLIGDLIGRIA